jgi:hypothetical protein
MSNSQSTFLAKPPTNPTRPLDSSMKYYLSPFTFLRWSQAVRLLPIFFFSSSALALVMRENGPEPIIIQIKQPLRHSEHLDNRLDQLRSTHNQHGMQVVNWWAGRKLLVMLSFPPNISHQQAVNVIEGLQQLPAVEKVVAASAYNLEFTRSDFSRAYGPNQTMPDVARRGFDAERFERPVYLPPDEAALARLPHLSNRLIVRWKAEHIWRAEQTGFLQRIANFHNETGCRVIRELRDSPTDMSHILEFDDPTTLANKLRRYMNSGWVEYAQPEFIYYPTAPEPTATPNDPVYNAYPGPQWSLPMIKAPQAWAITTGDPSVIIAVADSGAPVNAAPIFPLVTPHPDLLQNIWSGQNSPSGTRNFYDHNNDVTDDYVGADPNHPVYHGTLMASIIGARGNNALGMSGVAWNTSLMILKVLGPCGTFSNPCPNPPANLESTAFSSSVSGAVSYASQNHATAINCSFAGTFVDEGGFQAYDPVVVAAIGNASQNGYGGTLIVAAAGNNSGTNNDLNGLVRMPTSIPLDNVISVGATTIDDQPASYSNYGIYRVDLGAPGGTDVNPIMGLKPTFDGVSTNIGNYNFNTGTSLSAPHVTGAAALVKSKYRWETCQGIRDRILMGVQHKSQFAPKYRTKGRLDLERALQKRTLFRNISTRAFVGTGDQVLIGGFTISGGNSDGDPSSTPPPLTVAVRARGPSLPITAPKLANPYIELYHSSGKRLALNEDWQDDPVNAGFLTAYGMQPPHQLEAALVKALTPGAYTVVVSASPGTANGIGLVEIYELSGGTSERSRLVNLSTRCFVGTGDNVAIAGTIMGESVDNAALPDRRVLMLGRGRSLSMLDLPSTLQDPLIELYNSAGTLMTSNDSWTDIDGPYVYFPGSSRVFSGNALEEELAPRFFQCKGGGSTPWECVPEEMNESALWPTLRPGAYTVSLRGSGGNTGIGLIELYEN